MKQFYFCWAVLMFTAAGARAQSEFVGELGTLGASLEILGHSSKPDPGQSLLPKPSAEGKEALGKLLERCQAEGGGKEEGDAGSQDRSYALADSEKVKITVVANRRLLTPALRDAAFARWNTAFQIPARRQRATGIAAFQEALSSAMGGVETPIRRIDEDQQRLGVVLLRAIGEATGDDHALAFATFLAGQAEVRRGDYAEALRDYERAGQLFVTAKDPAWEAGCLNSLGWVYAEQGEYLRALDNFRRAKARAAEALGPNHPLVAACLENLGEIFARQEDYAKAEECLRQAILIRSKASGEHRPKVATDLVVLGDAYARQGNTAEARAQFERALAQWRELLDENKPGLADRISMLDIDKDMDKALGDLQALATLHKIYGDDVSPIAAVLDKIGNVFSGDKQYDDALDQYRRALDVRRKIGGDDHPGVALGLYNLGSVHSRQGKDDEAREEMRKAVLASRQAPGQAPATLDGLKAGDLRPLPLTTVVLHDYGRLLERNLGPTPTASQLQACARPYRLAADVVDLMRQKVLQTEASKISLGAERFDLFSRRIEICRRLFAVERKPEDLETAFAAAEQGMARVFLEQLGKSRAESIGGIGDDLRRQETDIINRLRELDDQIAREEGRPLDQRDARRLAQYFNERRQVESERLLLVTRMEREYPRYAALKYPRPCSPADARSCLGADEVALLYVLGSEAAHLIVVTKQADPETAGIAVHELGSADAIAEMVAVLTQPKTLEDAEGTRELGAKAYQMLLAPAAEAIRSKALIIAPGGVLGRLPFELLVEPADGSKADNPGAGRFLVEGHRLRYAPSLTALHIVNQWEEARAKPARSLWALGDPIYEGRDARLKSNVNVSEDTRYAVAKLGGAPGGLFERLPGSGAEVQRLSSLMEAAPDDILVGPAATEAAVKELSASGALARYRYVHFATHGILSLADGTQPALVLSLVGDLPGHEGFLELDEVTNLKLNADLVVLSACQTGQGRMWNAEGISGLARAFLYAGSRGVLCSLWRVDDAATAELMVALYSGLKAGQAASEALRSAQIAMIQDERPPLEWAPFILIGR